ncbi:MAG: 1,4-alpha-glucan branching enzyme [Candidatus Acidoferrum typicum]|nr:1,4-alpha-glucan branching enzyme [Candidatus Acidoferrum typicum]
MLSELRQSLPAQLPSFLVGRRWFGGKARQILGVDILDAIPIGSDEKRAIVLVIRVKYLEGAEETYSVPLITGQSKDGADSRRTLEMGNGSGFGFRDAFSSQDFLAELLDIIERQNEWSGGKGWLRGFRARSFSELLGSSGARQPKLLTGEQTNSSIIYGERLILKFFRRIEEGENPDLEIGRFLTERAGFRQVPRIAGFVEYQPQEGKSATQAILQEFVPNQGDAWRYAVKTLTAFYERVENAGEREIVAPEKLSEFGGEPVARLLEGIGLLGKRTADLHLALFSEHDDPAFAPQPFTVGFQNNLEASFADLTNRTLRLLRARIPNVPAEYKQKSFEIAAREEDIILRFRTSLSAPIEAMRTRIHGDYHLGQVLYTGSDFVIIDFEGEPARPLAERRVKQSPLQDVAGMLRSFHYAAFAPLLAPPAGTSISPTRVFNVSPWAEAWSRCAANRFLSQYYENSGAANYLPAHSQARAKLLEMYLLAKAIYELGYELNNRPTWVGIPLEGISALLSS